ncbi:uncharacterized protein LOC131029437 isoform X1 [Cryptomeria japonica]|uniref:uncharacterized protein LOC131029437 isoform X1 n=1 Tax=Cryptomeria japonica TaxID=3369 RepID=UPI0027D9CEAF|nr:uncharacterized protein LOC131029437 isoform X1 [Cryptomeria japonica]
MDLVSIFSFSPWMFVSSFLVLFVLIWILTYAVEGLRAMESSSRADGSTVFLEDPSSLKKVLCPSIFDPPEKYISLIIPAYNEELRLPGTIDETLSYLQQRASVDKSFSYEVVIVDDGSTDGTVKVAFDYVKKFSVDNVRVIRLGANYGKGAAIRKGMLHARGEILLMLDADGATKITDLGKLENQIKEYAEKEIIKESKISSGSITKICNISVAAFGSRAHLEKQAIATRKWYRNILMKGFHLCVLLVAGAGVKDTQCGFKMFTRAAARRLFINMRLKRWCFDVELVYLCKRINIPIIEISVTWTEIPGSKVRMTSIIYMLLELVLVRLGYGLHIWKIHN